MWSVLTERAVPGAATRRADRRSASSAAGDRRRARDRASDAAEAGSPTSSASAPASSRRASPSRPRTPWPQFQHEALQSHAATWPSSADEYGVLMQKKLRAAERVTPEEVEAAYRAIEEWRRYEPEVDLYVSPCYAVELPDEDADEPRGPAAAHVVPALDEPRPGWAGSPSATLQFVAPRDEVVLAAGLRLGARLGTGARLGGVPGPGVRPSSGVRAHAQCPPGTRCGGRL